MNDLIQRIVAAIFRQENNPGANPGNLRGAPWLKNPVIAHGFWVPPSRNVGIAGAAHVVALHIAEGNTLTQLIYDWAPPSDDNNTARYIANVKAWAAIPDEHVQLWNYIDAAVIKQDVA